MNKTIFTVLFACMFVVSAHFAPVAQAVEATSTTDVTTTTTADTNTTIAGLIAQLQKLTALFNELKAKLAGTEAEIKELRADIRQGMTDADIKTIQELLASDSTIYPQGLVTGYFGPMTTEAIKRFQAKNGLEVTGEIDTETRAAMDAIIAERKADGKFPVGLLLAPGLKDKFEDRLKDRCDDYVKATTTAAHPCARVKAKYNFWSDKMDDRKDKKDDDDDDSDDSDDDSSKVSTMRDATRQIADAEDEVRDVEKKLTKREYVAGLSSSTIADIKSDVVDAKKDIADAKAALTAKDYAKSVMLAEKAEDLMDDAKNVLEGEDDDSDDDDDSHDHNDGTHSHDDDDDEDEDEDEDDN